MTRFFATLATAAFVFMAQASASPPDEIIKTATDAVRSDIATNVATYRNDKKALYAMVDERIVPHFDTPYIAKVILGAHARSATPEQTARFETAFKDMLIRTYADKLLQYYDGIEIEVKPARIEGKRASVDTTIVRNDGRPPIPIVFSMRDSGGEWKIWDIKAENISIVLNYRTQVDAEIKKNGIPAVIERLDAGALVPAADTSSGGTS